MVEDGWKDILRESRGEGYSIVERLLDDFRAGRNRFDAPGEALYAHFLGQVAIAVCGINRETDRTYSNAGRIRRLYVLPQYRGNGLAHDLVDVITRHASMTFDHLTVNVGTSEARGFYEHLGFVPVQLPGITHCRKLP